jgi:hypothetical protein
MVVNATDLEVSTFQDRPAYRYIRASDALPIEIDPDLPIQRTSRVLVDEVQGLIRENKIGVSLGHVPIVNGRASARQPRPERVDAIAGAPSADV